MNYGEFGGQYVPQELKRKLNEIEKVFNEAKDAKKQFTNVQRMKLLGADVVEVTEGEQTLKEAVDVAFQYLLDNMDCYYLNSHKRFVENRLFLW